LHATKGVTYIDSHCHFDFPEFDEQRESHWQAARAKGITGLIIPSVSPQDWLRAQTIANQLTGIYWAAGLHPWWCENYLRGGSLNDRSLEHLSGLLEAAITDPRCVALGETGLDAIKGGTLELQKQSLDIHLHIANKFSRPIILHAHKTQANLLQQIKPYAHRVTGVVHAFSGSYEQAKQWVDAGFYLGVGGVITYERAQKTRQAIQKIPLDALLLETDAPSMPLQGQQGKMNSPIHLPQIAECLANLKQIPLDKIAEQTTHNTKTLFGLQNAI
jgi:TatD DNase family protein